MCITSFHDNVLQDIQEYYLVRLDVFFEFIDEINFFIIDDKSQIVSQSEKVYNLIHQFSQMYYNGLAMMSLRLAAAKRQTSFQPVAKQAA